MTAANWRSRSPPFFTPRSQYLLRDDEPRRLLAQDPVLMDGAGFTTEIGSATSRDGTSVDYFLLKPRHPKPGPQPLLMTGYGVVGISVRPGYSTPSSAVRP